MLQKQTEKIMCSFTKPHFSIFFGTKQNCNAAYNSPEFQTQCQNLKEEFKLKQVILLKQTHSVQGVVVEKEKKKDKEIILFETEGDFLVTNKPNVGIGIITADCLPIIAWSEEHKALGIAHAGWRGSMQQIGKKMIERMQDRFNIAPQDLNIYFGPSAKSCCYQVQKDFLDYFDSVDTQKKCIVERNGNFFFDLPTLNRMQLTSMGIDPKQINTTQNLCTLCHKQYHSYRRTKEQYSRQVSMTWLHDAYN
ncbi:MAG: peptidoglycan editing factor PgeF [Epsilonproteobacteria bacterium]|nr:peptidoglycan editing factor PgeF [Campylobacterota bacterium]